MNKTVSKWVLAARPKTLPAAIVPVLVGSALAANDQVFDLIPASVALLCAILIQIGTNFANDYYDFKKGTDSDKRIGFTRATSSGLISEQAMLWATYLTMGLAFLIGLYLVWHAGWIILLIGILSLLFGFAYTGGPYPLGYNGLGDVFVFVFFGIVAVMTTYYVQALQWSSQTLWASLAIGSLSTNILVINNLRDVETDVLTGKRTLGVLFGEQLLKIEYLVLVTIAFVIPVYYFVYLDFGVLVMLPLISIPLFVKLIHETTRFKNRADLNDTLIKTALGMTVYGLLFSLGILFQDLV
jgi:1,4-dihydroxy-2-naphthoate octaprenyltransferase